MNVARHASASSVVSFAGRGVTSRQTVSVEVEQAEPGRGIVFAVRQGGAAVEIPARWDFVVNTLRNVVLGAQGIRLCIVEHFLAAASLWGLDDLLVRVDGLEMPLGDGSALFWIELFKAAGWERKTVEAHLELKEPVTVQKGERLLMAVPDDRFSMSYHMDWDHPMVGKRWQRWDAGMDPVEIAAARTFGPLKEHQLLGLTDEVVSLTETGFTQELRFQDEPVRHKLLDLLGDLRLSGVNPMRFKARFLSIKAGHELDVEFARRLAQAISPKA
ncbi:MAG TPA: UDP-3-O-acyl-N-acetylglucosamine deacetylase [Candidatus Obscuribacterales bacterium]